MSDSNKDLETLEQETKEWLYSLDYVLEHGGPERVTEILHQLQIRAHKAGVKIPFTANTPYINTIPKEKLKLELMLADKTAIEAAYKKLILLSIR